MSYVNYNKVSENPTKAKQIQNGVSPRTVVREPIKAEELKPVEAVVREPVRVEIEEFKTETVGVVVECGKLNVRSKPDPRASVVCVISKSSEVTINEDESTEDFYKVCTAAGAEGFCMKEFIELK